MKNFILGVLTVLIIGGVGFFAYRAGQKNLLAPKENIYPTQKVVSTSPTLEISPTAKPTENKVNDNELIKQTLFDKNGWKATDEITVTVSTNDGKYASGTASAQGGGGYFFAIKENGQWKIIADGNGTISCESLKAYPDYPKTLIFECWDEVNQKNVIR